MRKIVLLGVLAAVLGARAVALEDGFRTCRSKTVRGRTGGG